MVVSNALASSGSASSVAYVSAVPGTFTFPIAVSAVVRNKTRAGPPRSVQMIDGGFDPIDIDAEVGDELSITVSIAGGGVRPSIAIKVPARRAPTVVRTNPPKDRTDVSLTVQVLAVFSEPVDQSSVTSSSVALLQDGIAVKGSVRVSADGLSAGFITDSPLQLETTYSMVINQGIRDLDGDALDDASTIAFMTEPPTSVGQLVFAQLSDRQIYRTNADGTGLTRLTSAGNNDRPVWSPDGRRIAFAKNIPGPSNRGWGITDIYLMDADGSNIVRRTVDSDFWSAVWSPDGRKLAISDEGIYYAEIYLISADDDGSSPTLLATEARSPAWSPDGKQIAYVHTSGDDGYHQVYVMNADGTGARPFTENDGGGIYGLAWSPNGKRIAYSKCLAGSCDLYVMDADGGPASQITHAGNAQWAAWSPDGAWIALTLSNYSGSEWRPSVAYVPAQGGTPRVVVIGGFNPSWRP
jgi:WD40 repeat protein